MAMLGGLVRFAAAVACFGGVMLVSCAGAGDRAADEQSADSARAGLPNRFGFVADGLDVDTVVVPSGAMLSSLLRGHGVQASHVRQVDLGALDSIFSPRKIRAGRESYFWIGPDSVARHWVYKHSAAEYLHLDFTHDTLRAGVDCLPVEVVRRSVHAVIESSLWNAMVDAGVTPELALRLSDIYAWTVDFFGLEKGDQFYLCFDEERLDSGPIGFGAIHAARYVHGKDTVGAYGFWQDSTFHFWDQLGRSLRKAFLKAPLQYSRVSSGFSYSRKHPILKIVRPHTGVDYAAPAGTPVLALGDGKVVAKGYYGGGGNTVKIRHNSVYTTGYLHLSRYGKGIQVGTRVKQGQVIGYVGSTGLATGPHLDFRVWRNGSPINPLRMESPSVAPLDSARLPAFQAERRRLDSLLDLAPRSRIVPVIDTTDEALEEW